MAQEIRTVTTLTRKRRELENAIAHYEQALARARSDLAHVEGAIAIFTGEAYSGADAPPYADLHRLFRRGEIVTICRAAMAKNGPMDTRELAIAVMEHKGFNTADVVLRKAIAYRIIQAMRMQFLRGRIGDAGKRKGVRVWRLKG